MNFRKLFTFHFNGKHSLNLSEVYKDLGNCHTLKCDCGKTFHYVPYSDIPNQGAILDEYNQVYKYINH